MEEHKDVLLDNIFIAKAFKLYNDILDERTVEIGTDETIEDSHIIGNLYRKKIISVKKEIPILEDYKNRIYNSLVINPLIFSNMWQFCQFIRWAEKVVFYKNITERKIYVDSAIDDYDCRLLIYSEEDFQVKFKLEKVNNPAYTPNTLSDILFIKSDTPQYFKSMKIVVERKYGKCMTNHFTIIDDNKDFEKDMSNYLLYKTIDRKISVEMINIIKEIYDLIYENYKIEI